MFDSSLLKTSGAAGIFCGMLAAGCGMAGVVDGATRRTAAGAGVAVRAGRSGVTAGDRNVALAVAVAGTVVGVFAGSASEEVDATISDGAGVPVSIYTTSGVESGARIGSEFGIGVAVMQPAKTRQPATQLTALFRFTYKIAPPLIR